MSQLQSVKGTLLHLLNNQMKVVDKLLNKISEDAVNFKPCGDESSLSLGELVAHMYEMVFAYSKAVRKGKLENEDFAEIPTPKTGATLDQIKDYIKKIKTYFHETLESLTEDKLQQEITFHCWHGFKLAGIQALMTIQEEVVHHRGQLTLYIRLLGIKLPVGFIYDYS
ncbi:DinB family protein [Candidatus Lokiarchaeum ossiferum]|uniref:DinB family protein n=1 Tax=Candidatus Lokiarchaeum ossiferum TaxID=2951803 RepID=UPI00352E0B9B